MSEKTRPEFSDITRTYTKRVFRANVVINPALQWYMVFFFAFFGLLGGLIFYQFSLFNLTDLVTQLVQETSVNSTEAERLVEASHTILRENVLDQAIQFIIIFALVILFHIMGGLYLSNRIAGPIYNMTKQLRKMREKNQCHHIKFRKNDYFAELADEFNLLVDDIDDKNHRSMGS